MQLSQLSHAVWGAWFHIQAIPHKAPPSSESTGWLSGSDQTVFWLPWKQSLAWRKSAKLNQSTSELCLPAKNNRIRTIPALLLIHGLMLSCKRQKQGLAALTPLINWIVWRLTAGHECCVLKSLHWEATSRVWLTRDLTPEKLMDFSLIS